MTDKKHDMVAAVKELALELGRTPTKNEFHDKTKFSAYSVYQAFGNYTILRQAAGFDASVSHRSRQIPSAVFETPIEKHLEEYTPREEYKREPMPSMAIISDIHWPFHAQRVIERFYKWVSEHKPEHIIINGDAMDFYSHSKFPRSHNLFTPKEEETLARKLNAEFWIEIQKLSPKSKCYQNLGNHDLRPLKRQLEAMPTMEHWIEKYMGELFSFEGVETNMDPRKELIIGGIMIHHGFKSKLGDHRDYNLQSSISSHTHRPGIVYRTVRGQPIFEMNTGYAGDPEAKGLTYTPTKTVEWVQSFGVTDADGPRIIL